MKYAKRLISLNTVPGMYMLLTTALCGASAAASAEEPAFTMTTIIDTAYGEEVAAGKYVQAIGKITQTKGKVDAFFESTNLCVAYTKTGNVDEASLACDAAVKQADGMSYDRRIDLPKSYQESIRKKYLAMALSNRGVLHAVTGDVRLAHQDFVEALRFKKHTTVVKTNLARLGEVETEKV